MVEGVAAAATEEVLVRRRGCERPAENSHPWVARGSFDDTVDRREMRPCALGYSRGEGKEEGEFGRLEIRSLDRGSVGERRGQHFWDWTTRGEEV